MRHPATLFFFQAEDGIRDLYVTGVQTYALPISGWPPPPPPERRRWRPERRARGRWRRARAHRRGSTSSGARLLLGVDAPRDVPGVAHQGKADIGCLPGNSDAFRLAVTAGR